MNYKELKKSTSEFLENQKDISLEITLNDISLKICITNDKEEKDGAIFGLDINIFNKTLDYSLIEFNGDIVEHKFYESFENEDLMKILNEGLQRIKKVNSICFGITELKRIADGRIRK